MLQPYLRGMNRRVNVGIHKINKYKEQLGLAQTKLHGDLFNKEYNTKVKTSLIIKIIEATEEKEKILLQTLKINWL